MFLKNARDVTTPTTAAQHNTNGTLLTVTLLLALKKCFGKMLGERLE